MELVNGTNKYNMCLKYYEKLGPSFILNIRDKQYILCLCHHLPERSIHFLGLEKFLCARCLGIVLGYFIGFILYNSNIKVPLVFSLIMIFPLIIDGLSQLFELRESNNKLRFGTGVLFMAGISLL